MLCRASREAEKGVTSCKSDRSSTLQEIPQLIIVYKICYNSPPGDFSEN